MADLRGIFRRPFAEQMAAIRLRLADLRGTAVWTDLWQAEHDRAFMVAGAMKADLLADLAAAVERAIVEGTGIEAFRRDFREIVERRGWHGWTGEGTRRGEAWRTKVIYKTNMQTSYAAGRWAQLMKAGYPFLIYFHGSSLEPQLEHLSWDGLILPVEHPFWATHAPPNGWGCSCYLSGARSERDAMRLGGKPGKVLPDGWQALSPKTGAPAGIDKGWAYAPGASVAETVAAMTERAVNWDYSLAVAYMQALPETKRDAFSQGYRRLASLKDDVRRWTQAVALPMPGPGRVAPLRTMGLATSEQLSLYRSLSGLDLGTGLYDFVINQDAVRHVFNRHGNSAIEDARGQRAIDASDLAALPGLLDRPDEVTWSAQGTKWYLRFVWVTGLERRIAIFDVRTGRRRISLVTTWIERIADAPLTFTP